MTIGKRIAALRKAKGYTQEYLAEKLGVTRQAVSKWEQDLSSPSTDNLIALSELLGSSVEYIAKGNPDQDRAAETEKTKRLIRSSRTASDVFIVLGILVILLFMNFPFGWIVGGCMIAFGCSLLKQAEKLEKGLNQTEKKD